MITTPPQRRITITPVLAGVLLSAGFTALSGASHSALAVVFGALLAVTLALPPLVNATGHLTGSFVVSFASVLSVIIIWLSLPMSWPQWWACVMVLTAYSASLSCIATLFRRLGIPAVVSSAIVLIIALAWLAWPVWLSPYLAGRQTLVDDLVFAHPLLAVNGALIDQAIWTERPQMYGWTALNQDVSYSMPVSVLWCVVLHGGIAVTSMATLLIIKPRKDQLI